MTPALRASARYWIFGTALAFAGVALTRLAAPSVAIIHLRVAVAVIGELVALVGLAIILTGIRRRLNRAERALAAPTL